jgi:putative SOS response-associated peptidase YedK
MARSNAPDGVRELMLARWGIPGAPAYGRGAITNIRNVKRPHWRGWLKPANRCVVLFTDRPHRICYVGE